MNQKKLNKLLKIGKGEVKPYENSHLRKNDQQV